MTVIPLEWVLGVTIDTYEKWCLRLSTARLNRWLHKVSMTIISFSPAHPSNM